MTPFIRTRLEQKLAEIFGSYGHYLQSGAPIEIPVDNGTPCTLRLELVGPSPAWPAKTAARDILELFVRKRARDEPKTQKQIAAELEAAGKHWGESTLFQQLSELVAEGWLCNRKDKRGYRSTKQLTELAKEREQ